MTKPFKVKPAYGYGLWLLNKLGMTGWCSVWGTIYIRPDQMMNHTLIAHEQVHARQIIRDGIFMQPLKYLFYTIRYGYRNNPYEIEARRLSGEEKLK